MNYTILTYVCYLPISIAITVWVARTLFRNGRIFLVEIFHNNTELADSVNKLLIVGFYLINIGYMTISLRVMDEIKDYQRMIEILSYKLGAIILILGAIHFLNLYVFFKLRAKSKQAIRIPQILQ
ncbi:MAG TPA: hypothetical protein VK890_02375, partial [Bacteroidia bacterium]|nr:hypothetical protein [Bacteroidia bacterium]